MVQQLFNQVETLKAEIKRLRGQMDSIAVGGRIIPNAINANTQIPLPIEGAIIFGTGVPDWGRLAPPVTAGDDYQLEYLDGDTAPSWQIKTSGSQDDVFIIGMAAML